MEPESSTFPRPNQKIGIANPSPLVDGGASLVEMYVSAYERVREAEREKEALRTEIIAYAKSQNARTLIGVTHTLNVKIEPTLKLPPSAEKTAREEIVHRLKDLGLHDKFMSFDFHALGRALVFPEIRKAIDEFLRPDENSRITVRPRTV